MIFERIEPPHYYAGLMVAWGLWHPLTPDRMCYEAGYWYYRNGYTSKGEKICQFSTVMFDVRRP